ARDIAQKFNSDFGSDAAEIFTLPEAIVPPEAARIMSLRDGTAKMSKSDVSIMSRIDLSDDADTIMKKVKKAKSDADALPSETAGLAERPEALNLVTIYAAMTADSVETVLARFSGQGFGAFKPALGEVLIETLAPISNKLRELMDDRSALETILGKGAMKARELAKPTLDATYRSLGLVRGG
ncbi:MAG: tryptophan--tRNA ligase, partial [Pontixanthobacter sp.]